MVTLGVIGRNTAMVRPSRSDSAWLISLSSWAAMKTIDHAPLRGYSNSPTRLNSSVRWASTVSKICFSPL